MPDYNYSNFNQWQMFLLVSGRHVGAHTDGHQHGVSIQIPINLVKKFLRISRIRKIAVTRILARVLVYLTSFISQILDFIYWPAWFLFWSILNCVTLKTSNWFCLKENSTTRRARGYLKQIYSFAMFSPNWRSWNMFYTCTFPISPHHFLTSRPIN